MSSESVKIFRLPTLNSSFQQLQWWKQVVLPSPHLPAHIKCQRRKAFYMEMFFFWHLLILPCHFLIMNQSWWDGLVLHNSIVVREVDLHSHDEWLHRAFKAPWETKLSLKGEKCPFVSPPADFGVFNPSQWRSLCPTSYSSQSSSARHLFIWTSHLDERSNMQSKSVKKSLRLLINYDYLTTLKSVHGWVLFWYHCYSNRWVPTFSSRVTNQVGITGAGFSGHLFL